MNTENALELLKNLYDEDCFSELDSPVKSDTKTAFGTIGGVKAYAYYISGALDIASCKKIKNALKKAELTGCPVIGIFNCDGLALNDGFELINEYGEIIKSAARLSGVVPQVAVINGACLGLCSALANLSDAVIATENSDFYINPQSDSTIKEIAENGGADVVCGDIEAALSAAGDIISLLPLNNLSPLPVFEFEDVAENANDIINIISDSQLSVEFKKSYAKEIKTVLTTVGGTTAGIINMGGFALTPAAAYKAESFIKLCDAYNIPLITVADSSGTEEGNEAQQITVLTKLVSAYASATCPKISLITKKSVAAAYIILAGKSACADVTLAWEGAVASPMSVESAVSFMWNDRLANGEDRKALEAEFANTLGSVNTAAESGAVDDVFAPEFTREKIITALNMLSSKRDTTIPRKHSVK